MLLRLRSLLAQVAPLALLLLVSAHVALAQITGEVQAPPVPLSLPSCSGTVSQYSVCEITLAQSAYPNEIEAYTLPDVKAVFRNSATGTNKTVHAFYDKRDGLVVFKIRFNASEASGVNGWSYTPSCSLQKPDASGSTTCRPGIDLSGGTFTVSAAPGESGFLRRDESRTDRFVYDNGFHPFIWGQTYYNIVTNALDPVGGGWKTAINQSTQRYKLNKVRMLLYPFLGDFPYRDSQPFKGDTLHDEIDLTHWMGFDQVVNYLYDRRDFNGNRILAEIILFTDTAPRSFGRVEPDGSVVQDDRYVRYAVARYGAFPNVMWCLANEWQLTQPFKNAAYWNGRANVIVNNDPWIFKNPSSQQGPRALSVHPKNLPLFQFFGQTWPSHAVLQYSIGHDPCNGSPCDNSDEWANFSIVNNRKNTATGVNPRNIPVVNDEYGYFNSRLKIDKDEDGCPHGPLSREMQRRGMWSIATAGGYGTFGDNTGSCPPKGTPPTIKADWIGVLNGTDPVYLDVKYMFDYFNTRLPSTWWQMTNNNARVGQANNSMRVYALEQPGATAADPGNYVVYSVPTGQTNSLARGQFKVKNLPKGNYLTAFYDPRTGLQKTPTAKKITKLTATTFTTSSYDDWVLRIFPDPQPPRPKSGIDEYEIVWVGDSAPAGAILSGANEGWNWIESDPTPVSDSYAHQSALVPDIHQHFFTSATETLTVNTGDKLFAYVYLDPLNPPSQVMLQWNDGTWEHRAYWGANLLPWGTNGTASRRYMGALPPLDGWVRLEVPASAVGLEGRTLNGMAFTLYGGMATWDDAGKTGQGVQATNLALGKATTQSSTYNNSPSQLAADGNTNGYYYNGSVTHTSLNAQAWWQVDLGSNSSIDRINVWNRIDCCPERLTNFYVFVSDQPFASTDPNITQEQSGVSTYYVAGQAGTPSVIDVGHSGRYVRVQLAGTNYLSLAEVEVFGQSGSSTQTQPPAPVDTVWVEDNVPAGASPTGEAEGWNWIASNPSPFSGMLAHQSNLVAGQHQHYFLGATNRLVINTGEKLFAYVYLDPANPPTEIMLQWAENDWEHRAYWGSNQINFGTNGTASRRYMGPLPPTGQWVRLEVSASDVGLEGRTLQGMAFTLFGGRATWDRAGKTSP